MKGTSNKTPLFWDGVFLDDKLKAIFNGYKSKTIRKYSFYVFFDENIKGKKF